MRRSIPALVLAGILSIAFVIDNAALDAGRRIVCVGTTTVRSLEGALLAGDGRVKPGWSSTDLFITPGFPFQGVGAMLTNFHLPRSTLFMLVCAFSGTERMKAAYAHAVAEGYRFFSYGDACLLYPGKP